MVDESNLQPQQSHPHWFVLTLLVVATAGITLYLSRLDNEKYRKALEDTVTARMEKFGATTQNQGNVVNYDELVRKTAGIVGSQMAAEISRTNGTIQSLAQAVGEVKWQIQGLKTPAQGDRRDDGSFTTSLEQNRGTNPSLSSVDLTYDAKKPGLTGLSGQWRGYTEVFTAGFGEWKTANDGVRSAVTLKRDIYKDEKKTQKVGTEVIDISNAEAYFSTNMISTVTPFPKYTFNLNTTVDLDRGYKGFDFSTTKWITREWGTSVGYSKTGPFKQITFGASYNYGKQ